jgi:lipoyl-dependent peroxiredoxin
MEIGLLVRIEAKPEFAGQNDCGTRHMDHKERNHPVMEPLYTAVASANGRDGRATSADGQLDLKLAFPPALGGDGNGTNPEQLFAAGYAACFASTLGVIGRETKVDTRDVSVTAEVSIGKDTDGGFGISVALLVRIPEEQDSDTVRALVEQAHTACPYSKATHGNIPVELRVQ